MGQGTKGLHGEGAALNRFLQNNRSDLGFGGSRTSQVGLSSTPTTPPAPPAADSTSSSLMYLAGAAVLFYIIYGSK
jgi:hypothetical protein